MKQHDHPLRAQLETSLGKSSWFIHYADRKNQQGMRAITPIIVLANWEHATPNGAIIAWCHTRDALRTFFIDSILQAEPIPRRDLDVTRVALAVLSLPHVTRDRIKAQVGAES